MLAVYFLPKVHIFCSHPSNLDYAMEEGRHRVRGFPAETVRSYSDLRTHPGAGNLEMMTLIDHALIGIDPHLGLLDGLSSHDSDIDLQEQQAVAMALRRGASIARAGYFTGGLSDSSSDRPYPRNLGNAVQNRDLQNSESDNHLSSSDSVAVSAPSSTAESSMPLLG